jgi:hypothetical protein
MAQEMHVRQGFLDGEDQKTLISFVLYGDPLATQAAVPTPASQAKRRALRFTTRRTRAVAPAGLPLDSTLAPETVAQIKTLVAQYLPEMRGAELLAARTRALPAGAKGPGQHATTITLAKTVRDRSRRHPHYARVTFDDAGQIVKLSVSR